MIRKYNPEEVKEFIKDLWGYMPDDSNVTYDADGVETEESYRLRQKDLKQHRMYTDSDWKRSGLMECK